MKKKEVEFYQLCFSEARKASFFVLQSLVNIEDLKIVEVENAFFENRDYWECSIKVPLGPSTIYLKVLFDSNSSRQLSSAGIGIDIKLVPKSILIDFIKEYLNMMMGILKSKLGIDTLDSNCIAKVRPTFDRATLDDGSYEMTTDKWKITWNTGMLVFECFIQILENPDEISEEEEEEEQKAAEVDGLEYF